MEGACVSPCLLDSFVAVLPAELENVPDDFLHQLEGLLDLRRHQRGEVNHPHVHLHGKRNAHAPFSTHRRMMGGKNRYVGRERDWSHLLPGKGQKGEGEKDGGRDRERGEDQHRRIKDKEQAENKMTQHGCLTRWFRLPQ